MKRTSFLINTCAVLLTFFCYGQPKIWEPAEMPRTAEEINMLKKKAQAEKEDAQARRKNEKDTAAVMKASIDLARAEYDLQTATLADLQRQLAAKGLDEKQRKKLELDKIKIQTERAIQPDIIKKNIKDLNAILIRDYQNENINMMPYLPEQIINVLVQGGVDADTALRQIGTVFVDASTKQLHAIAKEKNLDKRLQLLQALRKQMNEMEAAIAWGLEEQPLESRLQIPTMQLLGHLNNAFKEKQKKLDEESIRYIVDKENARAGFFARLAGSIRAWYRNLFGGQKVPLADQLLAQLDVLNTKMKPFLTLYNTLESLSDRVNAVQEQVKKIQSNTDPKIIDAVKQELNTLITAISTMEQTFATMPDKEAMNEGVNAINQLYENLVLYGKRSLQSYAREGKSCKVLFDCLVTYYRKIFDADFKLDSAYEELGLKPGATADEIEQAVSLSVKKYAGTSLDTKANRERQAGYILRNPIARQTYDAFLKDYNHLKSLGIDPVDVKRDAAINAYLEQKSSLADLTLDDKTIKALKEKVDSALFDSKQKAGTARQAIIGIEPEQYPQILTTLGNRRSELQMMQEQLEKKFTK